MVYIYVLRLVSDKFYVGSTTDVARRFEEHKDGKGSAWTKKYAPLEVFKIYEDRSSFDEDRFTKEYMSKYGIDNVRGGTYCQVTLSPEQVSALEKEIQGATNACYKCGQQGHFAKYCKTMVETPKSEETKPKRAHKKSPAKKTVEQTTPLTATSALTSILTAAIEVINATANSVSSTASADDANCKRCGRSGHLAEDCYAKTNVAGKYIPKTKKVTPKKEENICERCGRKGHTDEDCYATKDVEGNVIEDIDPCSESEQEEEASQGEDEEEDFCLRCGRLGHDTVDCYAKTDVEGNVIYEIR